jgi:RND family efflux transporter MFP subunit
MIRTAIALAAALAILGCDGGGQDRRSGFADEDRGIPAVEAVEVRRGTLPLEERLAGSVLALNQTEIYPEISGRIVELLVNDGGRVEAGDPLVRLSDIEYRERTRQAESGSQVAEARVKQAEANLTRLQATRRRIESLAEQGLVSAAELDTARADALSAEADLALMQAERSQAASLVSERQNELAKTVIRAPISGVVGSRTAEVGQFVSASTPLFVIGNTEAMRVRVTLTQRMLGYIRTGTPVNVVSEASPADPIRAEVSRISPFLHPVAHTTDAEIDLERPEGLRPGMFVTIDVLYGESELAALVPNSAVYRHPRDGREGVYAASREDIEQSYAPLEGSGYALAELSARDSLEPAGPVSVRFVPVEVIARGRLTSAIEGVQPGDWVVTLGHDLLSARDAARAVIQPTPWEHIMSLQRMQSRDLLSVIRDKQNRGANDANALN